MYCDSFNVKVMVLLKEYAHDLPGLNVTDSKSFYTIRDYIHFIDHVANIVSDVCWK